MDAVPAPGGGYNFVVRLDLNLNNLAGETLLIRGGTTSVGLAAAAIAKIHGAHVISTTRRLESAALLRENGASEVIIDNGAIAPQLRDSHPAGFNKVLELIGVTTLKDSLQCAKQGGIVCMTGIVGNKWSFDEFAPMEAIPTTVYLTSYAGDFEAFMRTPLNQLARQIAAGKLKLQIGKTFHLWRKNSGNLARRTSRSTGPCRTGTTESAICSPM